MNHALSTAERPRRTDPRAVASLAMVVSASTAVWMLRVHAERTLGDPATRTGWFLLSVLVLLMTVRRWRVRRLALRVHVAVSMLALFAFVAHVPRWVGDGRLEFMLSIGFWTATATGVYGWAASRWLPRRMTELGREIREVDIDAEMTSLSEDLHELTPQTTEGRRLVRRIDGVHLNLRSRPTAARVRFDREALRTLRSVGGEASHVLDILDRALHRSEQLRRRRRMQRWLRGWVPVHVAAAVGVTVLTGIHVATVWAAR